ncbi:MAG: hypothetical protein JST32_19555, partial [Bacteroidetes bacterium]|nr:hypothetical protein [Bacteroidota bacterium]
MMKNVIAIMVCGALSLLNSSLTPKRTENAISWLSVQYISCLRRGLPCDCEKMVNKFISITTDTTLNPNQQRISLFAHGQIEPLFYKLTRLGRNRYEILEGAEKPQKLGIITFNNGCLYLHDQNGETKYINIGKSDDLYNDNYDVENVKLINKALKEKGHPDLNKILSEDSLKCDCNKEVNLVYTQGKP